MVAIFTGAGIGFERGSGSVLGSAGLLGQASLGRGGEQLFLNAATGNLLISQQDEFLVGRGPDATIARTYNSLGNLSDDNGDNWRQSTDRRVHSLTGTVNTAGSTVKRVSADGSEILYSWDYNAYVATDSSGSHDKLTYASGVWTWTDGTSQMQETYAAYGNYWRISQQLDTDGNALTFTYTGDKLTQVAVTGGGYIDYGWSGNTITQITTSYTDLVTSTAKTQTRTRYGYDGSGRLSTVTVDLSPGDNSIADGKTYVTTYTYDGTSKRVASISQTDGSKVDISYDWAGRVTTLVETVATGSTRTTTLGYNAGYTTVTDPAGQVTTLHFSANDNIASHVDFWNQGNVIREAGTIDGAAATKFTVDQPTGWAGISHGIDVAAGDTVTFGLTLQAVGTVTSQGLGLYSSIDQWGAAGISAARIVSGPGQLVQTLGGLWTVTGLSTTQSTRIEVTRTYKQAETAGAYFYVDYPGGYRAGTALLVQDATLVKSATATDVSKMDVNNWSTANLTKTAAGTIDGGNAYKYTVQTASANAALSTGLSANAGDTYSFSISLKADGSYTSQSLGLYGSSSEWGTNATSSARIVSGPGTLTRTTGGLWTVTGLSTTQVTRIEVTRTYEESETGSAYVYVDLPGNHRAGAALIASAAQLTKRILSSATPQQLVKITAPPVSSGAAATFVEFAYDDKGNITKVTDAEGNETRMLGHTANGNVLIEMDRLGNTVTRAYGSRNELLAETRSGSDASSANAQHTTRYVYDSELHLRYIIGAEGNVVEYRYTTAGALEYQIDYPEHYYDVSALASYVMLTETQLDSWRNAIADRNSTKIIQNLYDARGNLTSTIRYGIATAAGAASTGDGSSRTYYTYDQAGQLLSTHGEGQSSATFVYDGLGRVIASTDVNGGTTSIVFNDASATTVVTLASGLVRTSTYNKAGELVASTESGSFTTGGTASYKYDKLGRLRQVTSAVGDNNYYLYDKKGRKIGEANHHGWLTEYVYDANDRLVAQTRYATAVSSTALAQLADPNSTVEMAAVRPTASSADIWSWSAYDVEGRVIETIDGDGKVTTFGYDNSGRLIKTVNYVNKLTATEIAGLKTAPPATGQQVLPTVDAAKDNVARSFYDKNGRVVAVLNGEGYLSRAIYDRAGQKVQEIAYYNPTNAGYRASGTLDQLVSTQTTSANDRQTRYVYDGQGLLRYQFDALNQGTKFNYNAAGHQIGTTRYHLPLGATTDYSYDNIKSMLNTAGLTDSLLARRTWSILDSAGRLAYSVDPEGSVSGFTYDTSGNVTKSVQYAVAKPPTNVIFTLAEMNSWAATQASNADSRIVRSFYTERGELKFQVDAEGYVTRYDYDADGRVWQEVRWNTAVSVNDSATTATVNGAVSGAYQSKSYTYDPSGKIAYSYDGEGNYRYFGYNGNGTLAWDIAMYGHAEESRTYYEYDGAGRVTKEYRAHGTSDEALIQYAYDGHGNMVTVIDPNNNTTTRTYDKLGRLKTQTNALNETTSYEYNAFGEAVKVTDARNNATYSYVDRLGRVYAVRDAEDYVTETAYTLFGEVSDITRRYNKATNAAAVATPPTVAAHDQDATTHFQYDKLGRLVYSVDAEGHEEAFVLDAFGQRVFVFNKLEAMIENSYDRRGLLVSETLPMSSFDSEGNEIATTVTNRFEYDSRGNRTKRYEAYGLDEQRITTYVYDKADRLIETWGDQVVVLDPADHVTQTLATPVARIKYDTRGNVIETTDANGARILYYYDKLNRVTTELKATHMAGSAMVGTLSTFTYDDNGNVKTSRVYGTQLTLPTNAGGTAPTPPTGEVRLTSYTYDNLDRLKTTSITGLRTGAWSSGSYVFSTDAVTTTLDYDAGGNVILVTDANGGTVFSYYDKLGRKTAQVDQEKYLTSWTHDAEGNVLTERRYATAATGTITTAAPPTVATTADDRVTNFTYSRNGRRLTEQRTGVAVWSVDANGNLVASSTSSTLSYEYNGDGQVRRRNEASGEYTEYDYDGAGRLIWERKAGYTDHTGASVRPVVRYYYDGLNNLVQTRQGGNFPASSDRITSYSYGTDGRMASMTDAAGGTHYYAYDAVGNLLREHYFRENSAGGTSHEGVLYTRDLLGRVTSQAVGSTYFWGWSWTKGDVQSTVYNAYGEVASRGINGGGQEQFDYDGAGRLWRTNSGDGIWRYSVYDKNGNKTLVFEDEGYGLANKTMDEVLNIATSYNAYGIGGLYVDGVNTTINVYSKRGQATETRMPKRQLSEAGTPVDLDVGRSYNAFGEVVSERDAFGRYTTLAYNTMGRNLSIQRTAVSITNADGTKTLNATPTDKFYYDVSGRLVGARDANGNYTTRKLLAGTGYGDSAALYTKEYHADGGVIEKAYDIFGEVRKSWDEEDRLTQMTYDKVGRLVEQAGPGGLTDHYAYDLLGQRIQHWNNILQSPVYGPEEQVWIEDPNDPYSGGHWEPYSPIIGYEPIKELTDYDMQGRIVSHLAFSGDTTTTSYVWSSSLVTTGMGTFGGWTQTTTFANTKTLIEKADVFGRDISKTDLGGHATSYAYDTGGRMTQKSNVSGAIDYNYLNTGLLGSTSKLVGTIATNSEYDLTKTVYSYDKTGNKLTEKYTNEGQRYEYDYDPYYGPYNERYTPYQTTYQDATATYDELGRLISWTEVGNTSTIPTNTTPAASIQYEYDANGNVRRSYAQYRTLDKNGAAASTSTPQENWYLYDPMNRVVIAKGKLHNGEIVRGYNGTLYEYDKAGQRTSATRTIDDTAWIRDPSSYDPYYGTYSNMPVQYDHVRWEKYTYDGNGNLDTVVGAETSVTDNYDGTYTVNAPPTTGSLKADYNFDAMGRLTRQLDYDGSTVVYDRSVYYYDSNRISNETTVTKQNSDTLTSYSVYNYGSGSTYALGSVVSVSSTNSKNGTLQANTSTTNTYDWYDGAVQKTIQHKPNTAQSTTYNTTYYYDNWGALSSIYVGDGRARWITFVNDMNGQALRRDEADNNYSTTTGGDPHEVWYRYNGKQLGYTGNNGTLDTDYQTSITNRTTAQGNFAFRFGLSTDKAHADFDLSVDPINSYSQGSTGSSYTARAGDTLQGIAASLWGDSSLWYKLAEANGMSGANALVEGQHITVPSGVMKSRHSASTMKPYDPGEVIGDTTPSTPTTPKPPKKNRCATFGTIMLAVIAIAVTAIVAPFATSLVISGLGAVGIGASTTAGVILTGVAGGAISGAAGSIVSQSIGVRTGLLEEFSWRDVAMAGISGAVSGGLGAFGQLSQMGRIGGELGQAGRFLSNGGILGSAAQSAVGSALTQGVAMATTLQKKFDWVGVAAAAAGSVGSGLAGSQLRGGIPIINQTLTNAAGTIASAAAATLRKGTSFGDNLMGALPGMIGSTIGNGLVDFVSAQLKPDNTGNSGQGQAGAGTGNGAAQEPIPGPNGGQVTQEEIDLALKAVDDALAAREALERDGPVGHAIIGDAGVVGVVFKNKVTGQEWNSGDLDILLGMARGLRAGTKQAVDKFDGLADTLGAGSVARRIAGETNRDVGTYFGMQDVALTLLAGLQQKGSRQAYNVYQAYIPTTQYAGNLDLYFNPWKFLPVQGPDSRQPIPTGSSRPSLGRMAGDFVTGVIAGDFSDNNSGAAVAGKVVGSFIPLADVRDIGAAGYNIWRGRDGAWLDLGLSLVGVLPVAGDLLKGALKHGDEVGAVLKHGDELIDVERHMISTSQAQLRAIAAGAGELNPRQAEVLAALEGYGSRAVISKKGFGQMDLAALSAATGDEFAMFTTGGRRLIVRGGPTSVPISALDGSAQELAGQGWRWSSHVHPDGTLMSSGGDRKVLSLFRNQRSTILTPTGQRGLFNPNGDLIGSGWLPGR